MPRDQVEQLADHLQTTLTDGAISRSERQALRQVIAEAGLTPTERTRLQADAFQWVRESLSHTAERQRLDWLEDVLHLLQPSEAIAQGDRAWFGPEDPMVEQVLSFIGATQKQLDCCVFTITDNRITEALIRLHRRGVQVRIISDDDKAHDLGSDIHALQDAGLACRTDRSPHHMHHKFAVGDRKRVLNGSYNWTRSADLHNRENLTLTGHPGTVARFAQHFEELWRTLA